MRSAICLYGVVGGVGGKDGKGGNVPIKECFESQQKYVIDVNNADVFIHSWSIEAEKELVSLYKPKKYKLQKQIEFDYAASDKKSKEYGHRSLSRWYSTKQVLELKKEYEIEHGFVYDCVMTLRFDLLFFTDFDFSKFDLKYLHASHWNTPQGLPRAPHIKADRVNRSVTRIKRPGFLDLWFFSNSRMMDEFTKVHEGIKKKRYDYSQHHAPWDHFVKNGYNKEDFRYVFYRHFDFELYRWHHGFYQTYREHL